ncbi:hypothetical protein BV25DRAFT_1918100 [Artomyces pyxidatus]|uniref:Uncharacterized protein n=1 Tax=Artomyces pyxidatus TaxID=48021 RepID=A0ACB8SWC6_9AGAM|nr:hypothetical protein BV25DRAFT_1918100 [Artomyces pyxidatus]
MSLTHKAAEPVSPESSSTSSPSIIFTAEAQPSSPAQTTVASSDAPSPRSLVSRSGAPSPSTVHDNVDSVPQAEGEGEDQGSCEWPVHHIMHLTPAPPGNPGLQSMNDALTDLRSDRAATVVEDSADEDARLRAELAEGRAFLQWGRDHGLDGAVDDIASWLAGRRAELHRVKWGSYESGGSGSR